jgi:hypothetical protein
VVDTNDVGIVTLSDASMGRVDLYGDRLNAVDDGVEEFDNIPCLPSLDRLICIYRVPFGAAAAVKRTA